jgi:hypothetical protein
VPAGAARNLGPLVRILERVCLLFGRSVQRRRRRRPRRTGHATRIELARAGRRDPLLDLLGPDAFDVAGMFDEVRDQVMFLVADRVVLGDGGNRGQLDVDHDVRLPCARMGLP